MIGYMSEINSLRPPKRPATRKITKTSPTKSVAIKGNQARTRGANLKTMWIISTPLGYLMTLFFILGIARGRTRTLLRALAFLLNFSFSSSQILS